MSIGLYDLVFDKESGLPKLKKVTDLPITNEYTIESENWVYALNDILDFSHMKDEHSYIACMSSTLVPRGLGILGIGETSKVAVNRKAIGSFLLLIGADKFLLFHNHPNGNCEPSESDMIAHGIVYGIGSLLDIELLDSIIVSKKGWYSIADNEMYEY